MERFALEKVSDCSSPGGATLRYMSQPHSLPFLFFTCMLPDTMAASAGTNPICTRKILHPLAEGSAFFNEWFCPPDLEGLSVGGSSVDKSGQN
jgi:hypothetical protein